MTVERAEAIRNPTAQAEPKVKAKEKPGIDKKEAVENKVVMHLRTIFNDADDNSTTYLKITMLERKLALNIVTKKEFQEQHPRGARRPREQFLHGQAVGLCEYAWTQNIEAIPALNGAAALITDYVDGFYSVSLMGKHRGQHVDNLRKSNLELIRSREWQQLFEDDQFLEWDIHGVDKGPTFLRSTRSSDHPES